MPGPGRTVQTRTGALLGSLQVTLDGSGNAVGTIGPGRAGEQWQITNTAISCTGVLPTNGQVSIWIETLIGAQIDSSYSVLQDQSDTHFEVWYGALIVCTWTNGPAGGRARADYYGTQHMIRR